LSQGRSSVLPVTDAPNSITPPSDLPRTLGELRASGHELRPVKEDLRDTLLSRLRSGAPRFPGIVGYDDTVLPEVERALLAGHDMVLLGERGQGKTRLMRGLVDLLDEWTPMIDGSELREHPYLPLTPASHRLAAGIGAPRPGARGRRTGCRRTWAPCCRSPGCTARSATARSSPPRTPASVT